MLINCPKCRKLIRFKEDEYECKFCGFKYKKNRKFKANENKSETKTED